MSESRAFDAFVRNKRHIADTRYRILQVKSQHGQQMTVSRAGARYSTLIWAKWWQWRRLVDPRARKAWHTSNGTNWPTVMFLSCTAGRIHRSVHAADWARINETTVWTSGIFSFRRSCYLTSLSLTRATLRHARELFASRDVHVSWHLLNKRS